VSAPKFIRSPIKAQRADKPRSKERRKVFRNRRSDASDTVRQVLSGHGRGLIEKAESGYAKGRPYLGQSASGRLPTNGCRYYGAAERPRLLHQVAAALDEDSPVLFATSSVGRRRAPYAEVWLEKDARVGVCCRLRRNMTCV